MDTVRGCPFTTVHGGRGCYGHCYLSESKARHHMKYWIPVVNRLNKDKLQWDLERITSDIVRNGVNGEPSVNWSIATVTAEFSDLFDKATILNTRFAVEPNQLILARLARIDTIVHGSVSALDPPRHIERILGNLWNYEAVGGRSVPRVITAWFNDEANHLWEVQDELMGLTRAFQQPLRIRGPSPVNKLLDMDYYGPTISNTDGRISGRWKSAHDAGYGSRGCYSKCYECINKCSSAPYIWGVWE